MTTTSLINTTEDTEWKKFSLEMNEKLHYIAYEFEKLGSQIKETVIRIHTEIANVIKYKCL